MRNLIPVLFAVLVIAGIMTAINATAEPESETKQPSKVENKAGEVLENAGDATEDVMDTAPDGKKVSDNFGEALHETGKVVGKGIGTGRAAVNNFGEALTGAGKTVYPEEN